MAKCVKHMNGTVKRVSDQVAEELVQAGYWHYVAKSVWKAIKRSK